MSCSDGKEKVEKKPQGANRTSILVPILLKDYNDATSMLFHKYEIDSTKASIITYRFLEIYDPEIYNYIAKYSREFKVKEFSKEPKPNLSDFVRQLSGETGLPLKTVSSYVMDLKMYMKEMRSD
tara:strand:- start:124 stop:495 length:372 start_codon:yes stop_codon:yes gene_type:complete